MRGMWKGIRFSILVMLVGLAGCTKEEDPKPVDISSDDFLGEWKVVTFKAGGEDQTGLFETFSFDILSNGDFIINKNGGYDANESSYGSYTVDVELKTFTVDLANPKTPSDAINGAWQVYAKSATSLTLKSFGQNQKKDFVLEKL